MEEIAVTTKEFYSCMDFRKWGRDRAAVLAMKVERVPLSSLSPAWVVNESRVARQDGRFFSVEGFKITSSGGREVSGWAQPLIVQQSGFVGLVVCEKEETNGSDHFLILVRLFSEPGNRGFSYDGINTRVLVGPPIQFSPGNLENHEKAMSGQVDANGKPYQKVPFACVADLVSPPAWIKSRQWEDANEDGGRFFEKVNRYGIIRARSVEDVEPEIQATGQSENFAWIPKGLWRELRSLGYLNGHMRSVSSLLI